MLMSANSDLYIYRDNLSWRNLAIFQLNFEYCSLFMFNQEFSWYFLSFKDLVPICMPYCQTYLKKPIFKPEPEYN